MHALNLDVHLWVSGNVLTELLQFDMYEGEASDNSKLALIYEEFRQWSRDFKVQWLGRFSDRSPKTSLAGAMRHSMPKFSLKRLKSWQHPYPELQAKAHNASWLDFDAGHSAL